MITSGIVTRQGFEAALAASNAVGSSEPLVGLAAPLDASWLGRISEAWDAVESALRDAYQWGREAAGEAVAAAVAQAEELVRSAAIARGTCTRRCWPAPRPTWRSWSGPRSTRCRRRSQSAGRSSA